MTPWLVFGASLSAVLGVERPPTAADCPDAEGLTAKVEAIVGRPLTSSRHARDGNANGGDASGGDASGGDASGGDASGGDASGGDASGGDASGTVPGRILVRVQYSRSVAGYEAHLRLSGAREGERVLRDNGQSCEVLADAVAVTVALLFDPAFDSPHARSSAPLPPAARAVDWWLVGRFGLGLGLVGGATWVGGGAVGLSLGARTWFELGLTTSGSHAHELGNGVVRVRLRYAELSGFHSLTRGELQLGPALSVLGGVTSGTGEGYASATSASLAYLALAAGGRAQVRLARRLLLSLRAEAVVPLQSQTFSVGYVGAAYRSSPLSLRADWGLAFEIW